MRIGTNWPWQAGFGAALTAAFACTPARAEDVVKIGLILPMTGGQASTGKQIDNAVKLYMQQHGDSVAGKKIQIILKDDGAVPDNTKRLAQELIVNEKVNFIAGFGVTPAALAAAPLATQGKIPEIVMAAGTSIITERSPYVVRTSFTLAQSSTIIGDWAAKNGIRKVAALTSDYALGRGGDWWRRMGTRADVNSEITDVLARFDLLDAMNEATATLPYGKQRLLEIAVAIAAKARVLLLDEPAAGVPERDRENVLGAVAGLPRDVTVLLIEHDMDLVFAFADRISVLVNGELLMEGTPDEVARDRRVKAVYLGETVDA